MSSHSKLGADLARELGASEAMAHAILPETKLDKALLCADPLADLIIAAARVHPSKKLASLEAGSVKKRFNEKSFATGVDRQQIFQCSQIGLDLDQFIELGLKAMREIADSLGL